MGRLKTSALSVNNPPVTSIAAHVILGLAMIGAVLLGTSDFSVRTLAYDLNDTMDLQGHVTAPYLAADED